MRSAAKLFGATAVLALGIMATLIDGHVRSEALLPDGQVLHARVCFRGSDLDAELIGRGFLSRTATVADLVQYRVAHVQSPLYRHYSKWRAGRWTVFTGARSNGLECVLAVLEARGAP